MVEIQSEAEVETEKYSFEEIFEYLARVGSTLQEWTNEASFLLTKKAGSTT